jgi:hypothetical protein
MQAVFTKLPTDEWGVKVEAADPSGREGTEVAIRTRAGRVRTVKLGAMISNGGEKALYAVDRSAEADVIRFTKVGDLWGIRSGAELEVGSTVEVTKSSGDTKQVIVGEFVFVNNYGSYVYTTKRAPKPSEADLPGDDVVPAGRYALELDGELRFVKVWRKGERIGVYDDDNRDRLPLTTLQAIADAGSFECAVRYGQLRKACSRCGVKLRNRLSVELAIGPECIKYWHDDVTRLTLVDNARQAIRARGEDPKETI